MRNRIFILGILFCCGLAYSCSKEDTYRGGGLPEQSEEILFGNSEDAGMPQVRGTQTLASFPNGGKIGILATRYKTVNDVPQPIDWTQLYIGPYAEAVAKSIDGNDVFSFGWASGKTQYWPFNGDSLVFASFSPALKASNTNLYLEDANKTLHIKLHSPMPDVMYASGNYTAEQTPYNKAKQPTGKPKPVDLGEFRHAMSKLVIRIVPHEGGMDPKVKVMQLKVSTKQTEGTFDLFDGTVENTQPVLLTAAATPFTFTLVNAANYAGGKTFTTAKPYMDSTYLFHTPAGELDLTQVYVKLATDDPNNYAEWDNVLSAVNIDGTANPLKLEKGKKTILTIKVKSTEIIDPNEYITLSGSLTDWNAGSNLEVIVQ